jgi:hypothetical protein
MTPEQWAAIIAQVFAAIQKCREAKNPAPTPPEVIRAQFRNPTGRTELILEKAVREANGMTRRQWRQNDAKRKSLMAQVHAERQAMTDEEINEFFEDAQPAPPRRRRK